MPLYPSVEAALRAQAIHTVAQAVKHRARCYARQPMSLDTAYSGLSAARPETMIAIGRHLIEVERRAPCRWFGFGGEVPLINAKAIVLFGRALRRARRVQSVLRRIKDRDRDGSVLR